MTKRDYVTIAMVIRACGRYARNLPEAEAMRLTLACHLAAALAEDNARFDRTRFLQACNAEYAEYA